MRALPDVFGWPILVGLILLMLTITATRETEIIHEIRVAGAIEQELSRTLIPIAPTDTTTHASTIHGYKFRVVQFEQKANASAVEGVPAVFNGEKVKVGEWYQTMWPQFDVRPGEITKLPIVVHHSYFDHAAVDLRVLYGPDANRPLEFPIDNVPVALRR